MKVLPPTTNLPKAPLETRHAPQPARYGSYRSCLRWDFGFTCAFCFLHEADLVEHGVEGTGLTWIEHRVPQSLDASQRDIYANCVYSCRYCNHARQAQPLLDANARRLLDPRETSWADHFRLSHDALEVSNETDADAAYTQSAYDLNDARKTRMRRDRREYLTAAIELLSHGPELEGRLLELAAAKPADAATWIEDAELLHRQIRAARLLVTRFAALPSDATACLCAGEMALPNWLAEQLLEFAAPSEPL